MNDEESENMVRSEKCGLDRGGEIVINGQKFGYISATFTRKRQNAHLYGGPHHGLNIAISADALSISVGYIDETGNYCKSVYHRAAESPDEHAIFCYRPDGVEVKSMRSLGHMIRDLEAPYIDDLEDRLAKERENLKWYIQENLKMEGYDPDDWVFFEVKKRRDGKYRSDQGYIYYTYAYWAPRCAVI